MSGGADRASFAIELRDETSAPANDAARALEALKKKIADDTVALRQMQAALRAMKGATGGAVGASKELRDKIDAQKASLAAAQARFVQLGGTFGPVTRGANNASSGLAGLLGNAQGLPGPLGAVSGRLASLVSSAASAAGALALVAGALLAVASAAIAGAAALLRYGIAQADVRRSELLRLEGLTSIRRWHGLAAASATELQQGIDRVSDATGVGRGQLEQYTAQLHRMGLRGESLTQALEGMSIVGAVQGDRMARRFAGMAASAVRTGRSVRGMTEDVRARLGGILARQMLSLDRQAARLRESFTRIFSDLRIEGFLGALNEMTRSFSQSTATGRALKAIVEALFNPLLDAVGGAGPLVRRFFQGMVWGLLQVTIGVLRVALWLKRTFGGSEILAGINAQNAAFILGAVVIGGLVGMLVVASLAAAAFVAVLAAVGASLAVIAAIPLTAAAALAGLVVALREAVEWFRSQDFAALGRQLVDGIVGGIRTGAERVTGAVRGLADRARGAFEDALGIASPSRVFAEYGAQITAGVEAGVEGGSGGAQAAVESMVSVPAGIGGLGGGTTTHVSIEGGIHVHAQSGEQARQVAESIRDQLAEVLEGLGVFMGAPDPEGA